jgi:D-amino peptidase
MKIFISVDMEGIAGVVHADHTERSGHDYELGRRLMTLEANAAVEGAFEAGATEVVVSDSHGTFRNLLPELLDQRAQVVSGQPKRQSMFSGLDASFAAILCVGYHSRAGVPGILDHTINDEVVADLQINGYSHGELAINAGMAGVYGVPVVLATGDSSLAEQASALVPGIEVAVVKWPITRTSARMLSPSAAQVLIRDRSIAGINRRGEIEPVRHSLPVTFTVRFTYSVMADVAEWMPGVQRVDGTAVSYTSDDYIEAFHCIRGLIVMAGVYR